MMHGTGGTLGGLVAAVRAPGQSPAAIHGFAARSYRKSWMVTGACYRALGPVVDMTLKGTPTGYRNGPLELEAQPDTRQQELL